MIEFDQIVLILLTSLATGAATAIVNKVDIIWIKEALRRHEQVHNDLWGAIKGKADK